MYARASRSRRNVVRLTMNSLLIMLLSLFKINCVSNKVGGDSSADSLNRGKTDRATLNRLPACRCGRKNADRVVTFDRKTKWR